MKTELVKYLKQHFSQEPFYLDRLIVSGFLIKNGLREVRNELIQTHLIDNTFVEETKVLNELLEVFEKYELKFDFETLIELFELVISPSEKVVNGAVYTPEYIRNYIVDNCLAMSAGDFTVVKVGDISCGCGGFLLTLAKELKLRTARPYEDIFRDNLFGIDIASYSIQRAKLLLTLFAIVNHEDREQFSFNLFTGDSLSFDWNASCPVIAANRGFDIIVGNPPYVCSRNMDAETLRLTQEWEVSRTGHPDLYIPFFQIGLELLNPNGVLGYITVNTFIKSVNGRALRNYFAQNNTKITLLNFGGEQVFPDRNTYTCLCFLKHGPGEINYLRTNSRALSEVDLEVLLRFRYEDLSHHDGWSLVNDQETIDFINRVENIGIPFKELYNTKNGIATLKNEVYKFKPVFTDEHFHYLEDENLVFPIEIGVCKPIINANKLKTVEDIDRLKEQIIFPYDFQTRIISEDVMQREYPYAYAYLDHKREILATRDKGQGEYEAWYAYGRRQSLDIHANKLFFPHISEHPSFVLCMELDLLFYNGIAVVSEDIQELKVIQKILESNLFLKYIRHSTKDYASGYISLSRNYLKNFGVFQFNEAQAAEFLATEDAEAYLENLYEV